MIIWQEQVTYQLQFQETGRNKKFGGGWVDLGDNPGEA